MMTGPSQTTGESLALALKQQTESLHRDAEQRPIQQTMLRGQVRPHIYAQFLATRLAIHSRLEPALRRLAADDGRAAAIIDPAHFQEHNLELDLADLKCPVDLGATADAVDRLLGFIDQQAAQQPMALLGVHYVLEGSKNGGRFLQPRVATALGDQYASATRYLNPHGDEQAAIWHRYRSAVDVAQFDASQKQAIIAAAQETFRAIAEIDAQLDV